VLSLSAWVRVCARWPYGMRRRAGGCKREPVLAAFHDADPTRLVGVYAASLIDCTGGHAATLPDRVAVVAHFSAPGLAAIITNH